MADYGDTWSLDQWLQLLDSLYSLFRLAVGKKISDEEVRWGDELVQFGGAELVGKYCRRSVV